MKNNIGVMFGVVLLLCWWSYDIYSDYAWADLLIEQRQSKGWTVVQTHNNFVDIARFWTIFKTPVTTVVFVKPGEIYPLENHRVLAQVLRVSYDYSRTSEDEHEMLNNCSNNRFAYLDNLKPPLDEKALSWSESVKADELVHYLCDRSNL